MIQQMLNQFEQICFCFIKPICETVQSYRW